MYLTLKNGYQAKLPDFLIVGAPRSGTTSLHYYLKDHPEVYMPQQKELYFLSSKKHLDLVPKHIQPVTTFGGYLECFKDALLHQKIGEVTPLYLSTYEATISTIQEYFPKWREVKIIMILREPVERAFSSYVLRRMAGEEQGNFLDAFQRSIKLSQSDNIRASYWYLKPGLYFDQVKAFKETFPHVKIFLYDDLVRDPTFVCRELFRFIGVDERYMPKNVGKKYNEGGVVYRSMKLKNFIVGHNPRLKSLLLPLARIVTDDASTIRIWSWFKKKLSRVNKKPISLSDSDKQEVVTYFADDVIKLQDLIQRDLSSWIR